MVIFQAFDDETKETEGLELDIVDQMKDLMLEDEKDQAKLTRESPVFDTAAMSTKVTSVSELIYC